jgi:hypothetical protein
VLEYSLFSNYSDSKNILEHSFYLRLFWNFYYVHWNIDILIESIVLSGFPEYSLNFEYRTTNHQFEISLVFILFCMLFVCMYCMNNLISYLTIAKVVLATKSDYFLNKFHCNCYKVGLLQGFFKLKKLPFKLFQIS